jgi:hypothetical protein
MDTAPGLKKAVSRSGSVRGMAGANRGEWTPVVFLRMSIICHNVMWHGRAFFLEIKAHHFLFISKSG